MFSFTILMHFLAIRTAFEILIGSSSIKTTSAASIAASDPKAPIAGERQRICREMSRGILRGKGVRGPIPSPTFTLMNMYEADGETLCHFDWYRIADPEEIWEAGFHEMLPGDTLAIVEWPERAEEALPDCRLEVRITAGPGEDERCITLDPEGGFHSLDTLLKDMEHFGGSIE